MNYKITFDLKTPVSFTAKPVFDALLAWCYIKDRHGFVIQSLSVANIENFNQLPIIRHEKGYFMASWMQFDPSKTIEYTGSWKKRWANQHDHLVDFKGKSRKVLINAGQYKAYDMPIVLHDIRKVWFYFQSNDIDEVQRLIDTHLWGIGKKTAQGFGQIGAYKIESITHNPFTAIIRPIPVEIGDMTALKNIKTRLMAWKPPYWLPENMTYCLC